MEYAELLPFLLSVFNIVVLDLLLSADNAAVIGMAICRLPEGLRKKAALCGTGVAIGLRIVFTAFAAHLLIFPFCRAVGGLLLLVITWKLLRDNSDDRQPHLRPAAGFWSAVGLIIVADFSMALDNVLAVAGAAQGQTVLVVFGLLLSVPILVFCSAAIAGLMERHPFLLWLGAAVLLHTALSMILQDTALGLQAHLGDCIAYPWLGAGLLLVVGVWKGCFARQNCQ